MSAIHPIVAVSGSSGAGTDSINRGFEQIFTRLGVRPAMIEGDSFHRYDRATMEHEVEKAAASSLTLTHFGPLGNLFEELEALFRSFAGDGTGKRRYYIHTDQEALDHRGKLGTFTPWAPLPQVCDILFYEGLHGALITNEVDVAQYADLLIGVMPIINLEWIQNIERDRAVRGYSKATATDVILRRMSDYVHYICPQFSRTDINFQRVSSVDTSNPFALAEIPSDAENRIVIHIANRRKIRANLPHILDVLEGSFMSRADTIVIPAAQYAFAVELLLYPVIEKLMSARDSAKMVASA